MNGTDLLEKMELVAPAYVEAADHVIVKKRRKWIKWTAIAACFVAVGAVFLTQDKTRPTSRLSLEAIEIPELSESGMGYEAYLCYDISELENGNPWTGGAETLPVYRNGSYDATGVGIPCGLSVDEMTQLLDESADALNLNILSTPAGDATELMAQTDGGTLCVSADGTVTFLLPDEGLALPEEYHFTFSDTTDEEAQAVLGYLIERYSDFLGFAQPIGVSTYDRDVNGKQNRQYFVYDAGASQTEALLNYCLKTVTFAPNDEGRLSLIRITNRLSCAELLGEYPLIDEAAATQRLKNGNYQTSVPYAFSGEEDIAKVELVYRNALTDEIFLPYYRFYVRQTQNSNPNAEAIGLEGYAIYYVPALTDECIVNLPVYSGRFN